MTTMPINQLGQIPKPQQWTPTAIACYKRGCICDGCFYNDFFTDKNQKCKMKVSVLELVRIFGKPENIII